MMIHTQLYACVAVVVMMSLILILLITSIYLDPKVMFQHAIRYLNER